MSKGIHNEEDLKKKLRWTHAETFIKVFEQKENDAPDCL